MLWVCVCFCTHPYTRVCMFIRGTCIRVGVCMHLCMYVTQSRCCLQKLSTCFLRQVLLQAWICKSQSWLATEPQGSPCPGIVSTHYGPCFSSGCRGSGLRSLTLARQALHLYPLNCFPHPLLCTHYSAGRPDEQSACWTRVTVPEIELGAPDNTVLPTHLTSRTKETVPFIPKKCRHGFSLPEMFPQLNIHLSRASWGSLWAEVMSTKHT